MAPLGGFDPSAAAKLANAAWNMRIRLMQMPEGLALIKQELENMRHEAQEKGAST